MMIFAGPVSKFVNEHPTIQILGLSFLILIGVMLLAEGSHLAHFKFFGDSEVNSIPKGYLYFAIFFSLFVEFLNLKMKKSKNPVQLLIFGILEMATPVTLLHHQTPTQLTVLILQHSQQTII